MKKSLIFAGMLCIGYANAQNYEGKIGINTEEPQATLDVKSKTGTTSATKNLELQNANGTKLVTVLDDGKVGIGTVNPSQKLEVNGTIYANSGGVLSLMKEHAIGGFLELQNDTKKTDLAVNRWRIYNMNNVGNEDYVPGLHFWAYTSNTNLSSQMVITDQGNLGVGFTSRVSNSTQKNNKLEVNGNARIVELPNNTGANTDKVVVVDSEGVLKSVDRSSLGTSELKATETTEQCTEEKAGAIHYKEVEVSGSKKGIFGFCTKQNGTATWIYLSNGGNIMQGTGTFGQGL